MDYDTREEVQDMIADYIKANLRVEASISRAMAYWDTDDIVTKVYLGEDLISETKNQFNI